MTMTIRRSAALVLAGCLGIAWGLTPQTAQAQAFGNRNLGGTISAGSRNSFGAGGGGAFGQSGSGVRGAIDAIDTSGDIISGNERYLRDNRSVSQFVGSDSADTGFVGSLTNGTANSMTGFGGVGGRSGFGGQGGFGGIGGIGSLGGLGGFGGQGMFGNNRQNSSRFGNNMQGWNRNRQINVRTRMTIGFPVPARTAPVARQTKINKILNSGRIATRGDLTVTIDQGIATLRGRVATESDREVALQLAKLEPGVETVRDELEIVLPEE